MENKSSLGPSDIMQNAPISSMLKTERQTLEILQENTQLRKEEKEVFDFQILKS